LKRINIINFYNNKKEKNRKKALKIKTPSFLPPQKSREAPSTGRLFLFFGFFFAAQKKSPSPYKIRPLPFFLIRGKGQKTGKTHTPPGGVFTKIMKN